MKLGNFTGLPLSLAFFTFLSLFITAGSYVVFQNGEGEPFTEPTDIVAQTESVALALIAAATFLVATIGINLVANFIPPAYDLANLNPQKISFKIGGYITAAIGFVIGALWIAFIEQIGLPAFVNTLGALLAPLYGVLIVDYYVIRRRELNAQALFSMDREGPYYYTRGWNVRALVAFAVAALFAVATVWIPALAPLEGFAWLIGAALGGAFYFLAMRQKVAA